MAELLTDLKVVLARSDHPSAHLDDGGELVIQLCGEVSVSLQPRDAQRWLRELERAIATTVTKRSGQSHL